MSEQQATVRFSIDTTAFEASMEALIRAFVELTQALTAAMAENVRKDRELGRIVAFQRRRRGK